MSVTSSRTPGSVVNSCATPSSLTEVTAAPSSEESSTRRGRTPERVAEAAVERLDYKDFAVLLTSSWVISGPGSPSQWSDWPMEVLSLLEQTAGLFAVQLDDQLLGDRRVDLLPLPAI